LSQGRYWRASAGATEVVPGDSRRAEIELVCVLGFVALPPEHEGMVVADCSNVVRVLA